jgi:hypothetical protein
VYAIKGLLRRGLRKILAELSRQALKKHKPEIVAVVGEGKTGIAREAIYHALKSEPPVRRNVEAPDAEFVLPLIILGVEEYPRSYFTWVKTLARSVGQLLFRPAYKHRLVLEISYTNKKIFDYFWNLTHPGILVICGEAPYLSANQTADQVFRVKDTKSLRPYLKTAIEVAKIFGIKESKTQQALADFSLPQARIKVFVSKKGGLIVDATHQYYPPSGKTVEEILEALPGKKIFITPANQKQIMGKSIKIKRGEIGVISGPKKKMWPVILELAKTPWFDSR